MRNATLGVLALAVVTTSGCVELAALLTGDLVRVAPGSDASANPSGQNPANGTEPPDADDGTPTGGGDVNQSDRPTVRLSVSNPSPLPNEEVQLRCTLQSGSTDGLIFAFQPTTARLTVDRQQGTASFVVDQSEVGIETTFTCTATNSAGTSPVSNPATIIAVDPGPAAFP